MNAAQHILVAAIRLYRYTFSPAQTFLFGPTGRCRFFPTCSEYALEAVRTHGALHGSWLAARRIARCHPWGKCGDDPVPSPSGSGHRLVAHAAACPPSSNRPTVECPR